MWGHVDERVIESQSIIHIGHAQYNISDTPVLIHGHAGTNLGRDRSELPVWDATNPRFQDDTLTKFTLLEPNANDYVSGSYQQHLMHFFECIDLPSTYYE